MMGGLPKWLLWAAYPRGPVGGAKAGGPGPVSYSPVQEQHPEDELIKTKQDEVNTAWQRLKGLALQRQGKLFGAAEVQRFNRYQAGGWGSQAWATTWRDQVYGLCS